MNVSSGLEQLLALQLACWPEHEPFLARSLADRSPEVADTGARLADLIWRLVRPDPLPYAQGYRWMCEAFTLEALHFHRTGQYRNRTFREARAEIYDNPVLMGHYMQGLLLSQVFWLNHCQIMDFYLRRFLPALPPGFRLLDLGPGHGLFSGLAASEPGAGRIEAWDVSRSSLRQARAHLDRMDLPAPVRLRHRDACVARDGEPGRFQGLILSEILEHVEAPRQLLRDACRQLAPGGRVFLNVPVNSPAPDHIYLFAAPEEVLALVAEAGLAVEAARVFPVTGRTEAQARRHRFTLSCGIIARSQG